MVRPNEKDDAEALQDFDVFSNGVRSDLEIAGQ
jgi:hypothetical protein